MYEITFLNGRCCEFEGEDNPILRRGGDEQNSPWVYCFEIPGGKLVVPFTSICTINNSDQELVWSLAIQPTVKKKTHKQSK